MQTTIPAPVEFPSEPTLRTLRTLDLGPLARAALELGLPLDDVAAYVQRPADRLEPLARAAREVCRGTRACRCTYHQSEYKSTARACAGCGMYYNALYDEAQSQICSQLW